MAKHKKPAADEPTPDPKPGLVELPPQPEPYPLARPIIPDEAVAEAVPPVAVVPEPEPTPEPAPAPAPVPPPDLTDQKTVHDLRVAGRLWRVREKAGGPAALLVTETKEQAEAAFRLLRPGTGPLKTEKLLP